MWSGDTTRECTLHVHGCTLSVPQSRRHRDTRGANGTKRQSRGLLGCTLVESVVPKRAYLAHLWRPAGPQQRMRHAVRDVRMAALCKRRRDGPNARVHGQVALRIGYYDKCYREDSVTNSCWCWLPLHTAFPSATSPLVPFRMLKRRWSRCSPGTMAFAPSPLPFCFSSPHVDRR